MATLIDARLVGERKRFRNGMACLQGHMQALQGCVDDGLPTTSLQQAVTNTAIQVARSAALIDELILLRKNTRKKS